MNLRHQYLWLIHPNPQSIYCFPKSMAEPLVESGRIG